MVSCLKSKDNAKSSPVSDKCQNLILLSISIPRREAEASEDLTRCLRWGGVLTLAVTIFRDLSRLTRVFFVRICFMLVTSRQQNTLAQIIVQQNPASAEVDSCFCCFAVSNNNISSLRNQHDTKISQINVEHVASRYSAEPRDRNLKRLVDLYKLSRGRGT